LKINRLAAHGRVSASSYQSPATSPRSLHARDGKPPATGDSVASSAPMPERWAQPTLRLRLRGSALSPSAWLVAG